MKFKQLFLLLTLALGAISSSVHAMDLYFADRLAEHEDNLAGIQREEVSVEDAATQGQLAHAQMCGICHDNFVDNEGNVLPKPYWVLHCEESTVPHIFH